VAISDVSGILASPLSTLSSENAVEELAQIITDNFVNVVYIGLPLHLSGTESETSVKATNFAVTLKSAVGREVTFRMIDERLSTKLATSNAHLSGREVSKSNVDQLAAAIILEFALDIERAQGALAGNAI
jgi:putative Holliday junction resolvase